MSVPEKVLGKCGISSPLVRAESIADGTTYMTAECLSSTSLNTEPKLVESLDGSKTLVPGENYTETYCCNADRHFCIHNRNETPQAKLEFTPNKIVLAWKKHILEFEQKEKRQKRKNRKHPSPRREAPKVDIMDPSEFIVGGRYRLIERIGNGSFGELYRAIDILDGEEVAAKVEPVNAAHPMLEREAKIYKLLAEGEGIPRIRYYGTERDVNFLVLDLLGPTLEDLLNFCTRTFTLNTTLMLADQMLARLEFVHQKCFVHRDIKPENFLMGLGAKCSLVYLIDFGLAKKFYNPSTGMHIEYSQSRELVGTPRYASVRAHFAEQGRRDDLESIGYMIIYFRRGRLPWQGIVADSKAQKFEQIAEIKASMPLNTLCSDMPDEFLMYLRYCRCLHFAEMPDYMYLRQMFRNLFFRRRRTNDIFFDWVDLKSLGPYQRDCVVIKGDQQGKRQTMRKNLKCCSCSYHKHRRRMDHQRGHPTRSL
ncbi:casein kinase I [Drosophila obscura]|uniref:casein kinase I n=1 Tax=Drosophila obscura TaxID=7282 RepID=UPI001BB2B60C|nr:casein kinase I [Drosophila obscura]